MNRAPLSPVSALVAHIEPLIVERRVVVIGNAERSLAEHLIDRGARLVQVLDPDPKRVAAAAANNGQRRVTYAQFSETSLRDGAFDCALVEDVNLTGDLNRLVESVRRGMSSRGLAIFCAPNPEASHGLLGMSAGRIDYDALCDVAEAHFEAVITLGQSPFLGYSVVQLDLEHPPEPALDNAFLDEQAETPDLFVAICGTEDALSELSLEEMSIVQLPAARFVEDSERIHRERELRLARRVQNLEKDLGAAKSRGSDKEIERLSAELNQRDTWIKQLESRAESADARADDCEAEVEELEKEVDIVQKTLLKERKAHEEEKRKLSRELAEARKIASESAHHSAGREALEGELNALDEAKKKLEARLNEKTRALERLEKRFAEQEKEIDDLHDQLDETETSLADAKAELAASNGPASEEIERDLRSLEEQLKKRGQRVLELEEQLKRLEVYAKTLAAEVRATEAQATEAPATHERALDAADPAEIRALAQALAEREADLVAARWTIGQLKQAAIKE